MTKILEDLGIYAIPTNDETCILASMLTAEPILYIGPPGTSKTELMYMFGLVLRESSKRKYPNDTSQWFNFNIYDTSKLNFEDLIGWPSPEGLKNDQIKFIPSPTTIWDKHLIGLDELNRCAEDRQPNVLELLRHRTCMGSPTQVKFIMSAINPFGDAGTNDMSDALTDRHTFFIHFQSFDKIDSENRLRIIGRVGNFDSIGIRYWTGKKFQYDALKDYDENNKVVWNDYLADQGDRLIQLIQRAADIYDTVHKQYFNSIAALLDTFVERVKSETDSNIKKEMPVISPRRAGMIARGFIAYRAIDIVRSEMTGTPVMTIANSLTNVIMSSIPFGIDKPANPDSVTRINKMVKDIITYWQSSVLNNQDADTNFCYDLYYTKDPIAKLRLLLEHPNIDNLVVNTAWNDIVSKDIELSCMIYCLYETIGGIIPDHLFNQERQVDIRNYIGAIKSQETYSDVMKRWSPQLLSITDKYKNTNPLLHTCNIFTQRFLNRIVTTDNEAIIGIQSLTNFLSSCEKIIETKKIENGTDTSKALFTENSKDTV